MGNVLNLRIGPCSLVWKGADLGFTLGGVKFSYERKMTDLKADPYGDSNVDAALTGTDLVAEFKVAEPVAAKIQRLIPEGSNVIAGSNQQVGFAAGEGDTMRQYAGLLTLHPLKNSPGDYSEDINIYLAYPSDNLELNYEVSNQRVHQVKMAALVSEAYTAGRRLGHIGPTNVS